MKEYNGNKLITMEDWTDGFDEIAKPGDYVEEAIVDAFINCVPPACMRSSCMQCGEAFSHREDPNTGKWKPTYATFSKVENGIYEYRGNCFIGENVERGKEPIYV